MEQILKILKQLSGTAGVLGNVPKPIKVALMYFGAFVGVFVVFKYAKLTPSEKTFLIIALILLAIITAVYYAWKGWMEKKQNQQFGGEISQHSAGTPRGLSDLGQRARLDDMRKKFQTGVEAYKSRGKDLYKLPWYVIVGEPGSGKTEAVRHSNIGFPPGMQDEFQGVGGTINMNWWFTNQAVLLDTAGRLMFEEVKPGETSEWREFLSLLKKNRSNCPINGLLLVIPSDSLIKDSADAIQKKAGKIAQQLDVIQRMLDVRFPVFVVVTKCDKMNGFREFFDGLTDPQMQHQMMGWSNPDPLDEPFKPEMVDKHLEQVGARLRRRRLGLLRDPIPENSDGRRTDEVDSLYALPHSLELLSSRLRRYLETIFIAGEWSAKPLFLRGIYFSSAMREGAALDAELAEAIGVSVEDLPEGKVWERERAYFLRDLFLEKIFREKGLVTRASNTKRMLRGQQIALYTFGFVSLALFSAFAWFAMGNLRSSVADHAKWWQAVSATTWDGKNWKRAIVPPRGDGKFGSEISTNVIDVEGKKLSLGELQVELRKVTEKPLKKNWMLPGLAEAYNKNRSKAQRIVFEAGVVRPLIEASRQKMSQMSQMSPLPRDEGEPGSGQRQPDALATLIQLEADILARGTGTNTGQLTPEGAKKFLTVFQNYIAEKDLPADTNLVAVMAWTYSTNDTAKGLWPPPWFSGGLAGASTLEANLGISAGLKLFAHSSTNSVQRYQEEWNQISSVRASVTNFADSERAFFAAAKTGGDAKVLEAAHNAVQAARANLVEQVAKASTYRLFAGGMSLTNAQQKFQADVTNSAAGALGRVQAVNEAALAANKDYPLFKDIKTWLNTVQASLNKNVTQLLGSGDPKEFQVLDDAFLAGNAFVTRADLYARAEKLRGETPFAGSRLAGLKGDPLEKFLTNNIAGVHDEAAKYSGKLKNEANAAIEFYLNRAEKAQSDAFFKAYLAEAKKQLANGGFPLVRDLLWMTPATNFMAAGKLLKYISDDLVSPVFQKYGPRDRPDWKAFTNSVGGQHAVVTALSGEDGSLGRCAIDLAAVTDATHAKDQWRGRWRNMKLISDGSNSEWIRTESDEKLGEAPVQNKLELLLRQNVGAETFTNRTPEWGPLWLIVNYKGERDKADTKTWLVELPVGPPGADGSIRLKLKFEGTLPELDKWPAQQVTIE